MKTTAVYVYTGASSWGYKAVRQVAYQQTKGDVTLDYDADDQLIGVEVMGAVQVDWNGTPMHPSQEG